ncbi:MAG: C4-dicarboxylate ABC transporter permease [Rubrivivax sp. SCN 71-131]|nr:MAG: C4-dicarboxylate ABC transporter permease [Rubrivivax sp. SCN 71-131]
MSGMAISLLMFGVLLALLMLGVNVGLSLLLVGGIGYVWVSGLEPMLNYMNTAPYFATASYSLSVIPLFVLMGSFATASGLSTGIFNAAAAWLGHRRGGVAMAAIGACAAFGAICGSSLATAATMAHVSLPEMKRLNYSGRLATGTLAAGGTLGILIPPSVVLVIYAILTEQSIGKLFLAAMVPGILAAVGYMIAISIVVRIDPKAGPAGPKATMAQKIQTILELMPVVIVFVVMMGGMYAGFFTPTEGAAVGAAATAVIAYVRGGMRTKGLIECLLGTAKITAMIFLILIGADLFNAFLAITQMPTQAANAIAESGFSPMVILALILLMFIALGCVMDSMSMILITIPVLFPIVMKLDFGMTPEHTAIWFGILVLICVETGLITPPFGLNVFVINSLAPEVPMSESFRGVLPFLMSDFIRVLILATFPIITIGVLKLLS